MRAVPSFWLGTLVMVFPSVWWRWSPPLEYTPFLEDPLRNLSHMIVPAILLGLAISAVLAGEYYRWSRGREGAEAVEPGAAEEPWTGVVEEIGHDEFDPTGTAWLVALYFLILLVMWVFVYFVEFLGGGPSVVG